MSRCVRLRAVSRSASGGPDRLRGVKGRERRRFLIELSSCHSWNSSERIDADPTALMPPCAGDCAIDEKDGRRMRGPSVEDDRPLLLRHHLCPASVDHRESLERQEKPNRCARSCAGKARFRQVNQHPTVLIAEAPQSQAFGHGRQLRRLQSRPACDVCDRSGTETAQISAHQVLHAFRLGDIGHAQPFVGQAIGVGARALPRTRGWDADQATHNPSLTRRGGERRWRPATLSGPLCTPAPAAGGLAQGPPRTSCRGRPPGAGPHAATIRGGQHERPPAGRDSRRQIPCGSCKE